MKLPTKVESLVKEITEKSPNYSESQVWATAWSIYCKHVEPGDKHCSRGPEGYLTKKASTTLLWEIAHRHPTTRKHIVPFLKRASLADKVMGAEWRSKRATTPPPPPRRLDRRSPDGHYQVWMSRESDPHPYISDYPSIQVAMRRAKETALLAGVAHVVIYDSLGNQFKMVRKASGRFAMNSIPVSTSTLPPVFKRVLAEVRFNKRTISVRTATSFSMYSAGDDGAKGFTALVDLDTQQYKTTWGAFGGGGLGQKPSPVDDTDTPRRPLPDHLVVVQGQIGGRDPYASLTCTPAALPRLTGVSRQANGDMLQYFADNPDKLVEKRKRDLTAHDPSRSAVKKLLKPSEAFEDTITPEIMGMAIWAWQKVGKNAAAADTLAFRVAEDVNWHSIRAVGDHEDVQIDHDVVVRISYALDYGLDDAAAFIVALLRLAGLKRQAEAVKKEALRKFANAYTAMVRVAARFLLSNRPSDLRDSDTGTAPTFKERSSCAGCRSRGGSKGGKVRRATTTALCDLCWGEVT